MFINPAGPSQNRQSIDGASKKIVIYLFTPLDFRPQHFPNMLHFFN